MQTLVIGDIHGCYDEFQSLLDKAGLTDEDSIVSVGDCVDRGPDTPAVLKFFQDDTLDHVFKMEEIFKKIQKEKGPEE